MRILALLYGVICYLIFFLTFLYAIGFVGNFAVPKTLDSGAEIGLIAAITTNMILLAVFALQHSIMARPGFKKLWTAIVSEPVERSTYVLFSSAALILLFAYWEPMGGTVWSVENPIGVAILYGMFGFGWLLVLGSTFLINHFDLFGLRQVWLYFSGKEYTPLPFGTPGPYKLIRHPLYMGWLFAFWSTPTMTAAHLLFAVVTTVYILLAIQFEERDLKKFLGQAYIDYCNRVPMIIPFTKRRKEPGSNSQ